MGADNPDWFPGIWPIRPTMGANQERALGVASVAIASGATGTDMTAVAAGKRLIISTIYVSCPVSVLNEFWLDIGGGIYHRQYFDVHGVMQFQPEGAPTADGLTIVTIYVKNNDTAAQTFRIGLAGVYEDR